MSVPELSGVADVKRAERPSQQSRDCKDASSATRVQKWHATVALVKRAQVTAGN